MAVEYPQLSEYKVYLDASGMKTQTPAGWSDPVSRLKALGNSRAVQRLRWGAVDVPATLCGFGADILNPPLGSIPVNFQNTTTPYVAFREKPGATT